ncbi:MAG TPA: hypothetical protein PL140_08415 [Ferrovaceae bacterium]|nr:hypothetical protein [Ferrovaceae bacterium]HQU07247.1 hypothetical protein [Ferrovaceae bacterium]
MRAFEFTTPKAIKPMTPDQAKVKSLQDQAKRAQQAVKAERARQKIQKAQKTLSS